MKNAVLIGLAWFIAIAVITGGAAQMGHHVNPWIMGFLVINAASSLLLGAAVLNR
jgi:hypothetical protein